MNKVSKLLIVSSLSGGVISSCQLDPYDIPVEEAYTREFIKQFGIIDKNQDWNIAERKTVTVNPGSATQVKVYAYVGDTRYIFADYSEVNGKQTLEFDLPEGIEDIIVRVNGVEKTTKVGGTVDFSGVETRTVTTWDNADGILTVTKDYWHEVEPGKILEYRKKLPEGERNVDKYTQNFHFVSNGDFVIYPIYYNTRHNNTLGIYVKDESGNITHYPISNPRGSGEIQYTTDSGTDYEKQEAWLCIPNDYGNIKDWGINTNYSSYTEEDEEHLRNVILEHADEVKNMVKFTGEISEITTVECPGNWSNDDLATLNQYGDDASWAKDRYIRVRVSTGDGGKAYTWIDVSNSSNLESYDESIAYTKFRSHGIKIHMAENVAFGMYIQLDESDEIYYSQEELNPDPFDVSDTDPNSKRACHAVTYDYNDDGKKYRVLAFEDWENDPRNPSDMDLNDMVFYITSDNIEYIPKVEDEDKPEDTPYAWLVACEDLGNTGDIDFNDIVFKVEHVSGHETATFTPLATGATLESYVYYKDANNNLVPVTGEGNEYSSEIHRLLGGEAPNFINTPGSRGNAGNSITLNVGTDFSMAYIGEEGKEAQNMGGFVIKTIGRETNSDGWEAETLIEAGGIGEAPVMICLPYQYEKDGKIYEWAWPKERVSIRKAYPPFCDWVGNSSNTDWYKTYQEGYVVTGSQVTPASRATTK